MAKSRMSPEQHEARGLIRGLREALAWPITFERSLLDATPEERAAVAGLLQRNAEERRQAGIAAAAEEAVPVVTGDLERTALPGLATSKRAPWL